MLGPTQARMQAILLHKLMTRVDTETKTGVHADMHTCPCVHIHRGASESPQEKGREQKAVYKQSVV